MTDSNALNWRIAFSDKTTGVAAVPQCLTSGDVFGDGAHRILIVTLDQKLICFEGQRMTHDIPLPDLPSSICVHYSGRSSTSIPLVAVGAGNAVFFFLNLRQYSKFTLPPPFKSADEAKIYQDFTSGAITLVELQQELQRAKKRQTPLCPLSISFLQVDVSTRAQNDRYKALMSDISSQDCVTALASIPCNATGDKATRLLIGTESRSLLLLDPTDTVVEKTWELGAPASAIRTAGTMAGISMIVVMTRDRSIKLISNMSSVTPIHCDSLPIDLAICSNYIYVALMSKVVKVYDSVGSRVASICFDHHIISLASVDIKNRQYPYCCVATDNGELTFINMGERVSSMKVEEGVSAMFFGNVGREPNNLLTISKQGGLFLRTLSRLASSSKVEQVEDDCVGPIPVPKKTKLFLDKCNHEKSEYKNMYKEWRNSLRYISLLSVNTYAQILQESVASTLDDVSFSVKVLGMGPEFVLEVTTVNSGKDTIGMVKVIAKYNPKMYKVTPAFVDLPGMVGGYEYTARFCVTSIDRDGKSDVVNVVATSPQFTTPLCSSIVQIPVSQFPTF